MSLESFYDCGKRMVSEGIDTIERHPLLTLGAIGVAAAALVATKGRSAATLAEEIPQAEKIAAGTISGSESLAKSLDVPILKGPWNEAAVGEVSLPADHYVARNYAAAKDSIVGVLKNGERQGTGFFIDESGLVATNNHVAAWPKATYELALSDGSKVAARVIAMDPQSDLSILRVLGSGREFKALPLGSSTAKGLDEVVAIGLPEEAPVAAASPGSFLGHEASAGSDGKRMRATFDMVMKRGNSGSPVLDANGNVIAVLNRYTFTDEAYGPTVEHLRAMYSAAREAKLSSKYLVVDTGLRDGVIGVLKSNLTRRPPTFPGA